MKRIEINDGIGTLSHVTGPDAANMDGRTCAARLWDRASDENRWRTPAEVVMIDAGNRDAEYEPHPAAAEIIERWAEFQADNEG